MAKGFKQSTLCWDCRMSTRGGCSWSRRFEPVEGWTAERSDLYIDRNHSVVSYCVQRCPKFVRDGLNFGQQRLNGGFNMPDREKVNSALEQCISADKTCSGCQYEGTNCLTTLNSDVLALLKEQEAVAPEVEVLNELDRLYRCPRCHKHFFYEHQKYCDQCGQAIKWD